MHKQTQILQGRTALFWVDRFADLAGQRHNHLPPCSRRVRCRSRRPPKSARGPPDPNPLHSPYLRQVDIVRPAMPLIALALTVVLCAVPVAQVGRAGQGSEAAVGWVARRTRTAGLHSGHIALRSLAARRSNQPPLPTVPQVSDVLRASGLSACGPVLLLHTFGYLLGYLLPRLLGFNEKTSRTGEDGWWTKRGSCTAGGRGKREGGGGGWQVSGCP